MDTVANMLTSLITAQRVGKERVAVPYSSFKEQLALLLQKKKMVASTRVQEGARAKLIISLLYEDKQPRIGELKRLSSPGRRYYVKAEELPWAGGRKGFYVLSTSSGLMDEREARRKGLGGELICEIWE